jgi:hypothetical protein
LFRIFRVWSVHLLGQNKSNSFKIYFNNSQLLLFIRARNLVLSRVGPRAPHASLPSLPLPLPTGSHASATWRRPLLLKTERATRARRGRAAVSRYTVREPPVGGGQAPRPPCTAWCPRPRTPLPPSFSICRKPEHVQKPLVSVPFPFPLCSFSPALKHTATSVVLP